MFKQTEKQPPTVRLARWSATHPAKAIIGWILFVAVCSGAGSLIGSNEPHNSDFWIGEAGKAESIGTQGGVLRPAKENVSFTSAEGQLDPAEAQAAAAQLSDAMNALPEVDSVAEPIRSADGNALLLPITIVGDAQEANDKVDALLEQTDKVQQAHSDLRITQSGDKSISAGLDEQLGNDLLRSEAITLPFTLIILVVVFGAIVVAGVPILLALSAIIASLGLYALASYLFPDAGGAVSSVIMMMGMAVGVDYSLFYLKRVREERARTGSVDAVELAARTSGRVIIVSGLAVMVSLIGLYFASDVIFDSMATGLIVVVLVAVASSLTVLPAIAAKLSSKIDGRPSREQRRRTAGKSSRLWQTLLRPAMNHPGATLLTATVAMIAIAAPALNMKLAVEGNDLFPRSVDAVANYDETFSRFPASGPAHQVILHDTSGNAESALRGLADAARTDPLFIVDQNPEIRLSNDGTIGALDLPIPNRQNSDEAKDSLAHLRNELIPNTLGTLDDVEYGVSGEIARDSDYAQHQADHLPWVLAAVLLMTSIMMLLSFRSIPLAILGVALNALSVLAAWGAITAVFQSSWAEGLLGFTSSGFISSRNPLMILAILFGLSMDYQIFVVSRIREFAERGKSMKEAVAQGITSSASVVTSAAVVMMTVFASFVFIDRIEMKQLGFGLALAVLLDAIVIRVLILPAALTLLGKAAWWPGGLRAPKLVDENHLERTGYTSAVRK